MDKLINEEIFEIILEKAFVEHEKEEQKTYPDDEELEKQYPANKKKIRKYLRILKEKAYGRKSVRMYVGRAAVVILCMISLFSGLIMINSDVKASLEVVVLKLYDNYTEFIFNKTPDGFESYELEDFEIGYIPENFELQFDNYYNDIRDLYFCNKKKDEAFFVIQIFDNTNTSVFVDNEQMLQKKIKIRGKEAWIMYNEFEDCGSLMIPDEKFSIFIVGDLSKKELIKIGENIK